MKKLLCLLLATLMIVGCFAACAKTETAKTDESAVSEPVKEAETKEDDKKTDDAPQDAVAEDTDATGFEGQVLKVAAFEGGFGASYWENICKAFEEAYGCTVELTTSPAIDEIVRPQIISGSYPDVLFLNSSTMALFNELVDSRAFMDLTEVFEEPAIGSDEPLVNLIADGLLETATFDRYGDGSIVLAPVSSNAQALVYNKTLFDANGWEVPTTWDEFFALGEEAAAKGYSLYTYPGLYPDYNEMVFTCGFASALGIDGLNAYTSYDPEVLKTDAAIALFENFAKIKDYLMPGTTGLNHTQSQAEFMLDKALFIPNGDWLPSEMADAPRTDGFEWAAAPALVLNEGDTPYYRLIVDGFGVMKDGDNNELAKEFVRFWYTDEAQRYQAEAGITTCTKNFSEVAADLLTDEKQAFLRIRESAGAASYAFASVDTRVVWSDYMWGQLADVMNGDLDATTWRESVIDAFERIQAGE